MFAAAVGALDDHFLGKRNLELYGMFEIARGMRQDKNSIKIGVYYWNGRCLRVVDKGVALWDKLIFRIHQILEWVGLYKTDSNYLNNCVEWSKQQDEYVPISIREALIEQLLPHSHFRNPDQAAELLAQKGKEKIVQQLQERQQTSIFSIFRRLF
jgi:hypothetical protein